MRLPHVFVLLVTVSGGGSAAAEPLTIYEIASSRGFLPHVARFTPDSRHVLIAGQRVTGSGHQLELRAWDIAAREFVGEHRFVRPGDIISLDVAPDGRTLLLGTIDLKTRGTHEASLWDWTFQPVSSRSPQLRSSLTHVRQIAVGVYDFCAVSVFSPDAKLVAVNRSDYVDPKTGVPFSRVEWLRPSGESLHSVVSAPGTIGDMAFSPDGESLATSMSTHIEARGGHYRRRVEIVRWGVESGTEEKRGEVTDAGFRHYHSDETRLAFSPDGRFIASDGPEWTVQIWNADTLEPLRKLEGLRSELTAVQFSPDGSMVVGASGTFEGRICIWSRESGQVLWKHEQPGVDWERASFSPDGNWLITKSLQLDASRKKSIFQIQLWDVHYLLGVGGNEAGELQ